MKREQKSGKRPEKKPQAQADFSTRSMDESIRNPKGNVMTQAIARVLEEGGTKVKVTPYASGYKIKGKGGEAYIEDAFTEVEELYLTGATISMESLRLPWFREAFGRILGYATDDSLYEALTGNELFMVPWSSRYYIKIAPQPIFSGEVLNGLDKARKAVNASLAGYEAYFMEKFSEALPYGFAILGPYLPHLHAENAKGLRSIVEEDSDYKKAVKAAKEAAKEIIKEAKNPDEVRRKIIEIREKEVEMRG
jgi:hypothetical protein